MSRQPPSTDPTNSILGEAPAIRALRDQLRRLAPFDTIGNPQVPTLLLQGETGTGKGLLARVTHESGPRANNPFIEINCAAIPENLLEAELFGFEAGAFTDAKRAKRGLFEAASEGTLFLDDVDTLPMPLQAKFLKVMEEKCVRRLGSVRDQQVDVKVMAATQTDLQIQINEGRFREDLYHRLAVVILKIPPLRERNGDIVLLARHFLGTFAEAHGLQPKQLGPTGEEWLLRYSWPGNIRELSHLMERATLLIRESVLEGAMMERLSLSRPSPSGQPGAGLPYIEGESTEESARIREALTRAGGNVAQAARLLGLGRDALRYRMRRYGIESPRLRAEPHVAPAMEVPPKEEDPATTLQENAATKPAGLLRGKAAVIRTWSRAAMALAALLLVAIVASLLWNFYRRPAHVSQVATANIATPLSISEKPSIAVLAFSNMSGDVDQEYIGDGLADNIITRLARIPEVLVIARNSSFTYKGKPVKVQEVGRELGVSHVVEGAVQTHGDLIRVNAQLVEAATGRHLWADSYDGERKDIFAIQDEITLEILKALQVKLTYGQSSLVTKHATKNLEAWEASVQGASHYSRFTKVNNAQARQLWQKAIELDPEFALGYTLLGFTHFMDSARNWSGEPERSLEKAEELAKKTLSMDDTIPDTHALLSRVRMIRKEHDKALAAIERSVALAPNNSRMLALHAHQLMLLGRGDESVTVVERAIRLHPTNRLSLLRLASRVYYFATRYDKAIEVAQKYLEHDPKRTSPRVILIASLVAKGREDEARAQAAKLVEQRPGYSITRTHSRRGFFHSFADPQHWELLVTRLKQAGLRE